jgi:hypothetical protein
MDNGLATAPPDPQRPPVNGSSLESDTNDSLALNQATVVEQNDTPVISVHHKRSPWLRIVGLALVILGLGVGLLIIHAKSSPSSLNASLANASSNAKPQTLSLATLSQALSAKSPQSNRTLTVNGQLDVANSLVLQPGAQPTNPTAGQIYYNQSTNLLAYYNGSKFIGIQSGGGNVTNNITDVTGGGSSGPTLAGTAGNLALFTGSLSLGNSLISQSGSTVNVDGSLNLKSGSNFEINGSQFRSSDLADNSDLAKLNANQIFTGTNDFTNTLQVQNGSGSDLFTVDGAANDIVIGNGGASPSMPTILGGAAVGSNVTGANMTIEASNGTGSATSGDIIFDTGISAENGIEFDSEATSPKGGYTTMSVSFTVADQSNRILIASLNCAADSVTYDGRPLTLLGGQVSPSSQSSGAYAQMWYLLAPPSGTAALIATGSFTSCEQSGGGTLAAASYYNVSQTSPLGTFATADGTVSSPTGSTDLAVPTTDSSQVVVDAFSMDLENTTQSCSNSINADQTLRWIFQPFKPMCGSDIPASSTGSSTTFSYTIDTSDWSDVGVALNPATPGSVPLQLASATTPDALENRLDITAAGNIGIDNADPQYALDVNGIINSSTAVYTPALDTNTPGVLTIGQFDATSIQLGNATTNTPTTVNGTLLVQPTPGNDSTTAFQVDNASGDNVLAVNTANNSITLGSTDGIPSSTTIQGGAAVGNNLIGGNLTFAAGNGTGVGGSGNIDFNTASGISDPQVSLDNTTGVQESDSSATMTWTHTTGSESDRIMVVAVDTASTGTTPTATSITYDGEAMTELTSLTPAGAEAWGSIWYLVDPPSGANEASASFSSGSGSYGISVESTTFYNVAQTNSIATYADQSNYATNTSLSLTGTDTGEGIFDAVMARGDWGDPTPGVGQTEEYFQGTDGRSVGSLKQGQAGSTTMSWTGQADSELNQVVLALTPEPNLTPDTLTQALSITQSGTLGIDLGSAENAQAAISFGGSADRTIAVNQNPGTGNGHNLTIQAGTGAVGSNNGGNLLLQGGAATGSGSGGSVIVQPQTDSAAAFIIQNSTGTALLTADTTGLKITITNLVISGSLTLNNAHFASTQTTAPTIDMSTCVGTPAVTAGSSDDAGSFTTGTLGTGGACVVTIIFNQAYGSAPKSVMLTPANAAASNTSATGPQPYVSSTSTTAFVVTFGNAVGTASSYQYDYWVVQ